MALAISVISARVGRGLWIMECNICVATITGFLWNFLLWHLNAQVAACHHDTESHAQYLIHIVYPFLILNLGDDLDRALQLIQDLLHRQHIFLATHEGVRDEVNIMLHREGNEA